MEGCTSGVGRGKTPLPRERGRGRIVFRAPGEGRGLLRPAQSLRHEIPACAGICGGLTHQNKPRRWRRHIEARLALPAQTVRHQQNPDPAPGIDFPQHLRAGVAIGAEPGPGLAKAPPDQWPDRHEIKRQPGRRREETAILHPVQYSLATEGGDKFFSRARGKPFKSPENPCAGRGPCAPRDHAQPPWILTFVRNAASPVSRHPRPLQRSGGLSVITSRFPDGSRHRA